MTKSQTKLCLINKEGQLMKRTEFKKIVEMLDKLFKEKMNDSDICGGMAIVEFKANFMHEFMFNLDWEK